MEYEDREEKSLSDDEKKEIIEEALERWERSVNAERDNHDRARQAIQFCIGNQWPDDVRAQRENDPHGRRPCLTLDKVNQYIKQIENDQRKQRPAIQVSAVDDKADVKTAKKYRGLIRNIEYQSNAEVAYDTGMHHSVNGGFGYWHIYADYPEEDVFYQELYIGQIKNRFSVRLDSERQMPDGSDSKWGFIEEMMFHDDFKEEYPEASCEEWKGTDHNNYAQTWLLENKIRVVNYYRLKEEEKEIALLADGQVVESKEYEDCTVETHPQYYYAQDDDPESPESEISQQKIPIIKTRKRIAKQLCWYKLTALDVLDYRELPGKYIPIVETIGNEEDIDGISHKSGLVEPAMDGQRLYNYDASAYVETVALQPKSPYVAADQQIEDYADDWEEANVSSIPVLRYKAIQVGNRIVAPPQRQTPPVAPSGWVQAMNQHEHDIQASLGMYNPSIGASEKTKSGRALYAEQEEADTGTFHYQDNLKMSIAHTGRILVDLIPYYYDTKRIIRILGDDDKEEMIQVDPEQEEAYKNQVVNESGGEQTTEIFNFGVGRYDVTVSSGPSFSSKRKEIVEVLSQVISGNPQMMSLVGDFFFSNMDWDGAEEVAERLRRSLPPELQVIGEDGEMQGPNQKFLAIIEQMKQKIMELEQGQEAQKQQVEAAKVEVDRDKVALEREKLDKENKEMVSDEVIQQLVTDIAIIKNGLRTLMTGEDNA